MIQEFHHSAFLPLDHLLDAKKKASCSISVVIPAKDEAKTVGAIIGDIRSSLVDSVPIIDEIIVIDGQSTDTTRSAAESAGADVYSLDEIGPGEPLPSGKGTALWKSLFVARGDIIVVIDADIEQFSSRFVYGLLGPLLTDSSLVFSKSFYRRPLRIHECEYVDWGGRVTEILVRPFLNSFYRDLSCIRQPLSGEYAFRRSVIEPLHFMSGYGVEIALLLDLYAYHGLDAMAQVDMDVRYHRNRPLPELGAMSLGILHALIGRMQEHQRLSLFQQPDAVHIYPSTGGWREEPVVDSVLPSFEEWCATRHAASSTGTRV